MISINNAPRSTTKLNKYLNTFDFYYDKVIAVANKSMFVPCCCLVAKSCLTLLRPHGLWLTRLLCPWDFPGKSTGVSFPFSLQGSSWPRGWDCVSVGGRFFTAETPGKSGLFLTLISKDNVKFQFQVLKIKMYFKKSSKWIILESYPKIPDWLPDLTNHLKI